MNDVGVCQIKVTKESRMNSHMIRQIAVYFQKEKPTWGQNFAWIRIIPGLQTVRDKKHCFAWANEDNLVSKMLGKNSVVLSPDGLYLHQMEKQCFFNKKLLLTPQFHCNKRIYSLKSWMRTEIIRPRYSPQIRLKPRILAFTLLHVVLLD